MDISLGNVTERYYMVKKLQKWFDSVSSGDIDLVLNLYSPDAVLLGTFSSDIKIGIDQIRDYFIDFLKRNPKPRLVSTNIQIIKNNYSVISGFYDFEIDNATGKRETIHARYTFVFRVINGNWTIISHHSSVKPLS